MLSQVYHVVRSRLDGSYLAAHPRRDSQGQSASSGFLLLFSEYADALSYLNTHAPDVSDRFAVESIPGPQVGALMKRWNFEGLAVVKDPLIPRVDFLTP